METKFYKCPHCGNVIVKVVDSGVEPVCCGKTMMVLDPQIMDGAKEKHVPMVNRLENGSLNVKVGEVAHPMLPEHHICFIAAESQNGLDIHYLDPSKPAETVFCNCDSNITAVYEYCNLHGLWKTTDIPK
jgi:superoxide reductase